MSADLFAFLEPQEEKKKSIEFLPAFAVKSPEGKSVKFVACSVCCSIVEDADTRAHSEYHLKNREI